MSNTSDLESLVSEVTNNAMARGKSFSRADAIGHIRAYQRNLVLEGRIPPNCQLVDTDNGLTAVES